MSSEKYTSEEIQVLKGCSRDSFYQRSLPFMGLFAAATGFAVKSGYLKGSPKWGALPKVALAVALGYTTGKVSYIRECQDRLMELETSELGDMIRRSRESSEYWIIDGKPYRLTKAELNTLDKCNRESLLYRSLPAAALLNLAVLHGTSKGYLKSNARFGPLPKLFLASLVGYLIGQLSYARKCAEKFINMPDSSIGEILRGSNQHEENSQQSVEKHDFK